MKKKTTAPSPKQTNAYDMRVGANLRALRLMHDISQQQLADKLGITFQQVQKYERGMNRIGAGRLYQIATFFGESVQYFFALPGSERDSKMKSEFLELLDRLGNQEDRRELLTTVKRFVAHRSKY